MVIPRDLVSTNLDDGVHVLAYESSPNDVVRNKITVERYLFVLLIEGTKNVYTTQTIQSIDDSKILLLRPGHYLMSEKIASYNGRYKAVLFLFSDEALQNFFTKFPSTISPVDSTTRSPVHVFNKDEFIRTYIQSLVALSTTQLATTMQEIKLEELLLYLCSRYPSEMGNLRQAPRINTSEIEFRRLVESSIEENVRLDELAFLCHMSLSTFTRKFIKIYDQPPAKWFLQRRMELARELLRNSDLRPSDIYYKVGYESHSSFTHSFKQVFGMTPKEFQQTVLA